MAEATVHCLFEVEVIEVNEVCPVEMSIDAKHLSKDLLANIKKFNREATTLANPFAWSSQGRKG
jgi:hypothetical protein